MITKTAGTIILSFVAWVLLICLALGMRFEKHDYLLSDYCDGEIRGVRMCYVPPAGRLPKADYYFVDPLGHWHKLRTDYYDSSDPQVAALMRYGIKAAEDRKHQVMRANKDGSYTFYDDREWPEPPPLLRKND